MTGDQVITALDLPAIARLDRRVPKKLLLQHGAPTSADKRRINEGIERIQWVAALKPSTIGVAAHKDDEREYLEVAVLRVMLRPNAKVARLLELLHRAVPYPVFALAEQDDQLNFSLTHKRWSQGEAGKTVLDGDIVAIGVPTSGEPHSAEFLDALALNRQPRESLLALYQGWMDTLLALATARRIGVFKVPRDAARRTARREALRECENLEEEITRLRAAAEKERQMARQVELNLRIKRTESAMAAAVARL